MSSALNFTLTCYDDVALSIINDFWVHSDKKDINVSILDNYPQYEVEKPPESPDIKFEVVYTGNESDPYILNPLSPSTSDITPEDSSFLSSEKCLSILSSTTDSIDIPLEWLEDIEDLPTLDESLIFEELQKIENESTGQSPTLSDNNNNNNIPKIVTIRKKEKTKRPRIPDRNKEFCCIACEKYFRYRSGLKKHFRTKTHLKIVEQKCIQDPVFQEDTWSIYRYSCFICGQAFVRECQVVDHIKIH